jgi:hypothetical protein
VAVGLRSFTAETSSSIDSAYIEAQIDVLTEVRDVVLNLDDAAQVRASSNVSMMMLVIIFNV